jgi:hypothetical protein
MVRPSLKKERGLPGSMPLERALQDGIGNVNVNENGCGNWDGGSGEVQCDPKRGVQLRDLRGGERSDEVGKQGPGSAH